MDAPPHPRYAHLEDCVGRQVAAVQRRGKFLVIPLRTAEDAEPDRELIIHLGMTGVVAPKLPVNHIRVELKLDPGPSPTLWFRDPRRFGRFLVVPAGDYRSLPTLHQMGPEPLSPAFTGAHLHRALGRSRSPVKTWLLSQRPVAGLGNIYVDESLWRVRVHPLTPARTLSAAKARALQKAIQDVLRAAIEANGTTLNDYRTVEGGVGEFLKQLNAYGHDGDPCPRCSTVIEKIVVGQRGTHFCPRCQRAPRPARDAG